MRHSAGDRRFLVLLALLGILMLRCGGAGDRISSGRERDPALLSLFYTADSAFQLDDYPTALTALDRAVAVDSLAPEIYFLRGRIFTAVNQFEKARAAFYRVRALDPKYRGVWFRLGHAAFQQENYQEALRYYERERSAIEAEPDRYAPDAYPAVLVQIGRCYTRTGETGRAVEVYRQVLSGDSLYASAYADLGQLYKNEGEFEKGLQYYKSAMHLAPNNLEYRYFYGYLLLQTGQPEAAVRHLQAVIERQPWHYGAQYNLGLALTRTGQEAEGQRHLEIADTLQDLDYDIQTAQRTVRTFPDNTMRWIRLGDLLGQAGRFREALQAYQSAACLQPKNLPLRNKLANVYVNLGRPGRAIPLYQEVLQQDSTLVNVWVNLGVAYARSGRFSDARQSWWRALRLNPGQREARRYLAE